MRATTCILIYGVRQTKKNLTNHRAACIISHVIPSTPQICYQNEYFLPRSIAQGCVIPP